MSSQLALSLRLEKHTRLEDYVGTAALKLEVLFGLVYVSGASGSGKSHLLQGLCHQLNDRGARTLYLEDLAEFSPSLVEGLEDYDVVCLDDVDTVLEQNDWQIALFHLINSAKDSNCKLVFSSSVPAALAKIALPDLASRVRSAHLIATEELTDQQKLEVVRLKAQRRGFDMSEEVCRFILSRSQRDMQHLAHLVEQLDEETLRRQKKVTIPFVKDALGL